MNWLGHHVDGNCSAHAARKAVVERAEHHTVVSRDCPGVGSNQPIAGHASVAEFPPVRCGMSDDVANKARRERCGDIGVKGLSRDAQRSKYLAEVKLVTAN